jgi:hypothetical protein
MRSRERSYARTTIRAAFAAVLAGALLPAAAWALPVFARIYDAPCGTCHTVFPQLNPEGDAYRARGLHGLPPKIEPLRIGPAVDVPGTLPLALYLGGGEDVVKVDGPGDRDPVRTHLNLEFLRVLGGGEIGRHLAFMVDYGFVETEPDTGHIDTDPSLYQAYLVAHAERWGWLGNLKAGWYELPLTVSPQIHRLSVRPYLIDEINGCSLLGATPVRGSCDDAPRLGETQGGLDLSASQEHGGFAWSMGFTNGSDNRLDDTTSRDAYVHATQAVGPARLGLLTYYSPDILGHGAHDQALRVGPDLDLYSRRFRLLGQFLAVNESRPTGVGESLWFYGGFLEANYRLAVTLVSLLRIDFAWAPTFDDRAVGGTTHTGRRLWEITGGGQWLLFENLKAVAEVTYGESHERVAGVADGSWSATLRLVTAFWPLTPPGLNEWRARGRTP